ncbi:MAG: hypothetical protein KC561_08225 [Myxococcales bacterium]|nr:hypothetical protein [Myxococcales bacterium]
MPVGDELVLVDWAVNEDSWTTVRVGRPNAEGAFAWVKAVQIAKHPEISGQQDTERANPQFFEYQGDLWVAFVDASRFEERVFIEQLGVAEGEPPEPTKISNCRGHGCILQ